MIAMEALSRIGAAFSSKFSMAFVSNAEMTLWLVCVCLLSVLVLVLSEVQTVAQQLMSTGQIDFLDLSLWDVFKEPNEEAMQGRTLMSYFTELERGEVRLGVAGKIRTPEEAEKALAAGADWIMLGAGGNFAP